MRVMLTLGKTLEHVVLYTNYHSHSTSGGTLVSGRFTAYGSCGSYANMISASYSNYWGSKHIYIII